MIAPPREIEDALKEALKEFTAIEPVYTGSAMPQADMEKFIQQWWFMDEAGIRRHERASHMVFCRACMEPGGTKAFTVRAYRMAVDFEISPLDHSMILAHTACLHCGESMVYAVNKQDLWNTSHPNWISLPSHPNPIGSWQGGPASRDESTVAERTERRKYQSESCDVRASLGQCGVCKVYPIQQILRPKAFSVRCLAYGNNNDRLRDVLYADLQPQVHEH